MFCGIVGAIGTVAVAEARGDGMFLRVDCPPGWTTGMKPGDSAAVDGACLTATELGMDKGGDKGGSDKGGWEFFCADLSPETLATCAPLELGKRVNLERALRAGDEIGGHFVCGHVDGTGEVLEFVDDGAGGRRVRISYPSALSGLLARKGSVAVAGVSLTVNRADADSFSAHLIPRTLKATTLGDLRVGDRVNLEADLLARHVARMLESASHAAAAG